MHTSAGAIAVAIGLVFGASAAFADGPPQARPQRRQDPEIAARAARVAAVLADGGKKVDDAAKTDPRYAATAKAIADLDAVRDDAERLKRAKGLLPTTNAIRAAAVGKSGVDLAGLSAKVGAVFPPQSWVQKAGSKVDLPEPKIGDAEWYPWNNCPVSDPSGSVGFAATSSSKRLECTGQRSMEATLLLPSTNKASHLEVTVPAKLTSLSMIVAMNASASSQIQVGITLTAFSMGTDKWQAEKECVTATLGHSAADTGFAPEAVNKEKAFTLTCGVDLLVDHQLYVIAEAFERVSITRSNGAFVAVQTKLNLSGFEIQGSK